MSSEDEARSTDPRFLIPQLGATMPRRRGRYRGMDQTPQSQDLLPGNYADLGPATRRMLRERAVELAQVGGRAVHEVAKADWDQARRELSGEMESKETVLE